MRITLGWSGPVGVGRFPTAAAVVESLCGPGVYLRVKTYDGGRTVSYVGQSKNLIARIDQHLVALLGFQTALRDDGGTVIARGDFADRALAFNDIDRACAASVAEAKRMRFYCAPCNDSFAPERLNLVEGALKERLESIVAGTAGLDCENLQGVPAADFDGTVSIENDLSLLAPEDAATVADIAGSTPIEIAERMLGMGHAE